MFPLLYSVNPDKLQDDCILRNVITCVKMYDGTKFLAGKNRERKRAQFISVFCSSFSAALSGVLSHKEKLKIGEKNRKGERRETCI